MFGHTNDHKQTEPIIHAHPAVDAISPPVDVAPIRQIALAPRCMLLNPLGLESADGIGRQAAGLLAQQGTQGLLKVAGDTPFRYSQGISSSTLRARFRYGGSKLLLNLMPQPLRSRTLGTLTSTSPMPV